MPTLTLTSVYAKNRKLVISAQEMRRIFLYGITINSPFVNKFNLDFSDEDIEFYIRAAQQEVENYFALKLFQQIFYESYGFDNAQWRTWGAIKCNWMIAIPLELEGWLNTTKQTTYPADWLTSKVIGSGELELYQHMLFIVPSGNTGAVTNSVIYAGLLPNLGYLNANRIPDYWHVKAVTGFAKIPNDIINSIGQLAAINLLLIAGSQVLGFPGLASQSLSIDGLSQSLSAPSNSYGQRITAIATNLEKQMANQRDTYRGFNFGVA